MFGLFFTSLTCVWEGKLDFFLFGSLGLFDSAYFASTSFFSYGFLEFCPLGGFYYLGSYCFLVFFLLVGEVY